MDYNPSTMNIKKSLIEDSCSVIQRHALMKVPDRFNDSVEFFITHHPTTQMRKYNKDFKMAKTKKSRNGIVYMMFKEFIRILVITEKITKTINTPMNLTGCGSTLSYAMKLARSDYSIESEFFTEGDRFPKWDDGKHNNAVIGNKFCFIHSINDINLDGRVEYFEITRIQEANTRPDHWDMPDHQNRRVLTLSRKLGEMTLRKYNTLNGYTKEWVQGTTRMRWTEYLVDNTDDNFDMEEYKKFTYTWLCDKFPGFYKIKDLKSTLLCGKPQSGKSVFTFACALMEILRGKSVVLAIRNSEGDLIQMASKVKRFAVQHVSEMKKYGFIKTPTIEMVEAQQISSIRVKEGCEEKSVLKGYESVVDAMVGPVKKLVAVMSNGHQLQYINRLIDEYMNEEDPLVLLTDEADAIGYSEILNPKHPQYHSSLEYSILKDRATQSIEITATVFDVLLGNTCLTNRGIVVVQPTCYYKGIRTGVQFETLRYKVDTWTKNGDEGIFCDANLFPVYNYIGQEPVFGSGRYGTRVDHPVIILHKTRREQAHHDSFFDSFKTGDDTKKVWTVIREDGRGFKIYSDVLRNCSVEIGGENYTDSYGTGEFEFKSKKIGIQKVIQYFYDNGGANKFGHIVIKSGDVAGRSRSYVSVNGEWHLTHMYYVPSKSASIPTLIQGCRLNHNRPDSVPLLMYAPKKTILNLQKGDLLQDEQIERLIHNQSWRTARSMKESVWNKKKVPSVKMYHSKLNSWYKTSKVKGVDGGWGIKVYTEEHNKVGSIKEMLFGSEEDEDETYKHLEKRDNETFISLLKRSITNYDLTTGTKNRWKSAAQWFEITGLCGYKNKTTVHHKMMTRLVKDDFIERKNNKLRLKK
jgi:hypothetical protein